MSASTSNMLPMRLRSLHLPEDIKTAVLVLLAASVGRTMKPIRDAVAIRDVASSYPHKVLGGGESCSQSLR